jgi:hypothetical protein
MGIGPIVGIRPITMVKPSPSAPDLSGVFAIELRGQERDETYSPSNQSAARGLEDEELEDDTGVDAEERAVVEIAAENEQQSEPHRKVNFFA